jgi:hypothetical protein
MMRLYPRAVLRSAGKNAFRNLPLWGNDPMWLAAMSPWMRPRRLIRSAGHLAISLVPARSRSAAVACNRGGPPMPILSPLVTHLRKIYVAKALGLVSFVEPDPITASQDSRVVA